MLNHSFMILDLQLIQLVLPNQMTWVPPQGSLSLQSQMAVFSTNLAQLEEGVSSLARQIQQIDNKQSMDNLITNARTVVTEECTEETVTTEETIEQTSIVIKKVKFDWKENESKTVDTSGTIIFHKEHEARQIPRGSITETHKDMSGKVKLNEKSYRDSPKKPPFLMPRVPVSSLKGILTGPSTFPPSNFQILPCFQSIGVSSQKCQQFISTSTTKAPPNHSTSVPNKTAPLLRKQSYRIEVLPLTPSPQKPRPRSGGRHTHNNIL